MNGMYKIQLVQTVKQTKGSESRILFTIINDDELAIERLKKAKLC